MSDFNLGDEVCIKDCDKIFTDLPATVVSGIYTHPSFKQKSYLLLWANKHSTYFTKYVFENRMLKEEYSYSYFKPGYGRFFLPENIKLISKPIVKNNQFCFSCKQSAPHTQPNFNKNTEFICNHCLVFADIITGIL